MSLYEKILKANKEADDRDVRREKEKADKLCNERISQADERAKKTLKLISLSVGVVCFVTLYFRFADFTDKFNSRSLILDFLLIIALAVCIFYLLGQLNSSFTALGLIIGGVYGIWYGIRYCGSVVGNDGFYNAMTYVINVPVYGVMFLIFGGIVGWTAGTIGNQD